MILFKKPVMETKPSRERIWQDLSLKSSKIAQEWN